MIIRNPHVSEIQTYSGNNLYNYQEETLNKVLEPFGKYIEDRIQENLTEKYFHILELATGEGKTFLLDKILEEAIKMVWPHKQSITIIVMAPRNQLIEVFQEDLEQNLRTGLKRDGIPVLLYSSLKRGWSKNLNSYSPDIPGVKILILTDQSESSKSMAERAGDDLWLAIRDEGLGLDSNTKENAKEYDGIFNPQFVWHDNFNSMPAFKIVLNATPSESQKVRKKSGDQIIFTNNSDKRFIKPIAGKCELMSMDIDDPSGKTDLLIKFETDFISNLLTINYHQDKYKEGPLSLSPMLRRFKPSAVVKATTKGQKRPLIATEVLKHIQQVDMEYAASREEFVIFDMGINSELKVKYPGEKYFGSNLLSPVLSNQHNYYDIDSLNEYNNPDNILIVTELGTYGINVQMLTHLCYLRPTERHPGRASGVVQFCGRVYRHPFRNDYIILNDIIAHCKSVEQLRVNLDFMYLCMTKNLFFTNTENTRTATSKWKRDLPSLNEKEEFINQILIDNQVSINSQIQKAGGTSIYDPYADIRTGVCSKCGDEEYLKKQIKNYMMEYGLSEFIAHTYAISDLMQNAHYKDKDGKWRELCFPCHARETRMKGHWKPKGHPDRIE